MSISIDTEFLRKELYVTPDSELPLIIYRGVYPQNNENLSSFYRKLFISNDWNGIWEDGIFTYQHYHETTDEVLGVAQGEATVEFGGEKGITTVINKGDVIIIPVNLRHRSVNASKEFIVIGAYPNENKPDNQRGKPTSLANQKRTVALPGTDPVFGISGPLLQHWSL